MEKKILTCALIATFWLLSLCITTQCAIHETNQRHREKWHTAKEISSISPAHSTEDYITPSKAFKGVFKEDL